MPVNTSARTLFLGAALVIAVSRFAAAQPPITKAHVADLIVKVEHGVDEFRKYIECRGDNAGGSELVGSKKRGRTATESQKYEGQEGRPRRCVGRLESIDEPSAPQVRSDGYMDGDQVRSPANR